LVTSPFAMLKSPLFMVKSTFFMVELLIFPVKSLSLQSLELFLERLRHLFEGLVDDEMMRSPLTVGMAWVAIFPAVRTNQNIRSH
jgi:hypothetical protein